MAGAPHTFQAGADQARAVPALAAQRRLWRAVVELWHPHGGHGQRRQRAGPCARGRDRTRQWWYATGRQWHSAQERHDQRQGAQRPIGCCRCGREHKSFDVSGWRND